MKGFFNRLLRIDLTNETFKYEEIPDELLRRTFGGKGLGAHFLFEENPPGVDPYSPENIFIIATGPVTGTKMWSQSRFGVFSKSPVTRGYGESYCGGTLAPKIKGCGVDAIIIKGKSVSLKYLFIDETGVSFFDASAIRGSVTCDAEDYIEKNCPAGTGAMVIGPAGENLVKFACIKSDRWRSLGRGGMGAVLGSKNIKGIAFNGKKNCQIADSEIIKKVVKAVAAKGKDSPVTEVYVKKGTPNQVRVTNSVKCFPTRYWTKGYFDRWEKISAEYMQENFEIKSHGCPNCFLQCSKQTKVKHGRHQGLTIEGPEFETIYAIGGLNEIDSLEEIAWLNDLCDRLGMDTMTAGNISAFAVEAYRAGKIDYKIDYNDPQAVGELYQLIADRKGVGEIFAGGIKDASEALGMEDIAVHVKGLDPAGFDPRVLKGMGLSYATAARGACHLRATFYKAELSGQMDKDQIEGKARLHIDYEDRATIFDSLVLCRFFRDFVLWDELRDIVKGTTGMDLKKEDLENLANSITQLTRKYNHREGLGPETDTLPERFFKEKTAEGASLKREDFETMLREYNEIRERGR